MSRLAQDERVRAWLAALDVRTPVHPQVKVDLGRSIEAWWLRLACVGAAAACTLLVASTGFQWLVAAALIAAMAVWPSGPAASLFMVGIGVLVVVESDPFDARVFLLVLGLHLTALLAAVVAGLAWRARVEVHVLASFAKPFLAIQGLAQAAALLGAWATTRWLAGTWLPAAAGVALAGLAWAVVVLIRADEDRPAR